MVVCSANVARSPFLAALLQGQADERLGAGAVEVGSAGVYAAGGHPAAETFRRLAIDRGCSLEEHRSRPIVPEKLIVAPLVLTMSRRQRQFVARPYPPLLTRTFTVREFVWLLRAVTERSPLLEGMSRNLTLSPRQRVVRVVAAADRCRPFTRLPHELDVPDPMGAGPPVFRQVGDELVEASAMLADALFGEPT